MEHIIQRYTHSHTHADPFQLTSAEVRMIRKINSFMCEKGFSLSSCESLLNRGMTISIAKFLHTLTGKIGTIFQFLK